MKKQIVRISPLQTSKIVALCYLVPTIIFVPIGLGILLFGSKDRWSGALFCAAPAIYAALAFVLFLIGSFIYNFIAKRFGGIEVTVADIPDKPAS